MAKITELHVNDHPLRVHADAERSLLSVLRDDLELTGAKYGCGEGQCGACTVLIDGTPTHSCLTQVGKVGQNEGAIVMGLGGALFETIRFNGGKILNPRFSRYRVPRFSDAPEIEIVLLDRKDLPSSGAGETPMVGIAPAVGNAICDAVGVRLRSLPMAPKGVKV